jgi:hypothetical protein
LKTIFTLRVSQSQITILRKLSMAKVYGWREEYITARIIRDLLTTLKFFSLKEMISCL